VLELAELGKEETNQVVAALKKNTRKKWVAFDIPRMLEVYRVVAVEVAEQAAKAAAEATAFVRQSGLQKQLHNKYIYDSLSIKLEQPNPINFLILKIGGILFI
jgi:hypothetical protein